MHHINNYEAADVPGTAQYGVLWRVAGCSPRAARSPLGLPPSHSIMIAVRCRPIHFGEQLHTPLWKSMLESKPQEVAEGCTEVVLCKEANFSCIPAAVAFEGAIIIATR